MRIGRGPRDTRSWYVVNNGHELEQDMQFYAVPICFLVFVSVQVPAAAPLVESCDANYETPGMPGKRELIRENF